MPLFLCRWPNGDCSVVWAPHKADAIVELDQAGNAEACPVTQVRSFQVHFVLNEQGKLMLVGHVATTKLKHFKGRGKPVICVESAA